MKLEPGCAEAQIYVWTGSGDFPFDGLSLIEDRTELSRSIREIGAIGLIPMEDFQLKILVEWTP